jgi:uncharacterized membrane protein
MTPFLVIFLRWVHLVAACLMVGGIFFLRFIFPAASRGVDAGVGDLAVLRVRRGFKMVVHSCILLLLISGTYNAVRYWPAYTAMGAGLGHSLFGLHLLLGLVVFGIALWLLMGAEPPESYRKWAAVTVALLLLTILVASTLKYFREQSTATRLPNPAPVSVTVPPPG